MHQDIMLFFKEKPTKMLLTINQTKTALYAAALAKKNKLSYADVNDILHQFEDASIILFEKHGRLQLIVLTEKGKKIAEELEKVVQKF
jgi:DNA-binding MarR family transcriptional regulator